MAYNKRRAAWCLLVLGVVAVALASRTAVRFGEQRHDPRATDSAEVRCSDGANAVRLESSASARPPKVGSVDVGSVPFDVGAIIEQVHFAYRPHGTRGGHRAEHATYAIDVDVDGVAIRAYRLASDAESPARRAGPRRRPAIVEGAPLRIAARVERDGRSIASGCCDGGRVASDGHLAVDRGEVVEHYRNHEDGVEQSWSFERAPSGDGDVVVIVATSGLDHVATSDDGNHFVDPRTGLGFRYGHATWVDARGVRTEVPGRYEDGAITFVMDEALVASSAYPAVLDPLVSPEFGVGETIVGPTWKQEVAPAIAANGFDIITPPEYLIVWQDYRTWVESDVYGARVSAGNLLDVTGIAISTAPGEQLEVDVESNGEGYLVVWRDTRGADDDIYGTFVSATGAVNALDDFAVSTSTGDQAAPDVSSNGTDYLVVWQDDRSGTSTDVYGSRVSAAGSVSEPNGLPISTATSAQTLPAASSDGTDYFVVWADQRSGAALDIYGTAVSGTGVVASSTGIAISTASGVQTEPAIDYDGTNHLVVWRDARSGTSDIYGSRVSQGGSVVDAGASALAISTASGNQATPSVAFSNMGFLVIWTDTRSSANADVYGARVFSNGGLPTPLGIVVSAATTVQSSPCVASNGFDFMAAWQDTTSANAAKDIVGTRVTNDGSVVTVGGATISNSSNDQYYASSAFDGTRYLIAWSETRASEDQIYGARVSATGDLLDPSGFVVVEVSGTQGYASVATNGDGFLVSWYDFRNGTDHDIYGALIDAVGPIVAPASFPIAIAAGTQGIVSSASDGTDYLVVWLDMRGGAGVYDAYGARVTHDGDVLDPAGIAISTLPTDELYPSVASDGSDYVVAWYDRRSGSSYDIYATTVASDDGSVSPTLGTPVSIGATDETNAQIASNGTDYLITWVDGRNGPATDIYGARFDESVVLDPNGIAISTASEVQARNRVAASGGDYFVAWRDFRNGLFDKVYGTRIRGGVVESTGGVDVSPGITTRAMHPNVDSGPDGSFLVLYERVDTTAGQGSLRVFARTVVYGSDLGNLCGDDTDCESGHCVDDVCCDVACAGGTTDCQACSMAAGAAVDGTCGAADAVPCSDELACTSGDACTFGTCTPGPNPCFDGTSCSPMLATYACSSCPAGTRSTDGSGVTDCVPCSAGQFALAGATTCSAWSTCTPGNYVLAGGSATTDRDCEPCAAGEFSVTTDAVACAAWSVCGSGEFASTPGSPTADRVCTPCSTCGAGTTQVTACASNADTVCEPLETDAGVAVGDDAGVADGGVLVELDANVEPDAGDAGVTAPTGTGGGCGCTAAGANGSPSVVSLSVAIAMFVIAVATRKNRRALPAA